MPRTDSSGLAFVLENTQHFTGIVGAEFVPTRSCVAAVNPADLINLKDLQKVEIHITAITTGACKDADRKARFELVYLAIDGIRSFIGDLNVTYESKRGIWIGKIQKIGGHSDLCTAPTGFDTGVKLESYDAIKFGFCS